MPALTYTEEQRRSIEHPRGHSLTFAVAGSGKTHMLVGRVLFLLEQGLMPERIRVLAFNRAAATEFRDRLTEALPVGTKVPEVRTFHSLGLKLTAHFETVGLLPRRRLEARESIAKTLARQAAQAALREEGADDYPSPDDLEAFARFIDLVKSDLLSAADAFEALSIPPQYGYFIRGFARFEEARAQQGLRFFADLQSEPVALLSHSAEAQRMVTNKLDAVIVDEFQDVSRVQVELLRHLVGTRASLSAVGDDSQCIYVWRGSKPQFMGDDFDHFFPGATRYSLSRTFRFGHSVSLAAAQLIAYNADRIDTLCVSAPGTPHTRIEVIRGTSSGDQAGVVAAIEAWYRSGRRYRDCAVLGRLWGQTLGLELALLERGIPFTKPGKDAAFQVPDVAGLLGYLRLAAGTLFEAPNAREIIRHMLGTPSLRLANRVLDALIEAILQAPGQGAAAIAQVAKRVKMPFHAEKIRERAALWREATQWRAWPAADALRLYAARTDLLRAYATSADSDTASEKQLAYDTLLGWATRTATSVPDFLSRMDDLRRTAERYAAGGDVVLLSSIHQAKGREWPMVVVLGLEEGLFPAKRADRQEERRLAYVALTRCKEALHLVIPPDAHFDAQWRGEPMKPYGLARCNASLFAFEARLRTSRELGEAITRHLEGQEPLNTLPAAPTARLAVLNRYLGEVGIEARYERPASMAPGSGEPQRPPRWALNDRIRHRVFGEGFIVGLVDRDIVDIDFNGQLRRIKTSMAPLERL
ncbi:ATP-dependent helicase [Thiorhodococcus minor]|uniref:DNA 3'-5' helicase n=1 Tax=Thiorhodococcus minor TaxID=57489 RepID=A0A6M0JSW2_9GAMM|nr:ATP-dependent helicase [Thiorhodococcus minor]NEV60319.1 ATP-dependent helicase [Thiorhodococcus minor]